MLHILTCLILRRKLWGLKPMTDSEQTDIDSFIEEAMNDLLEGMEREDDVPSQE